ncbi:hypothetical protein DSO57_1019377 [Entomophthora muscae]|uniref:Uncharacterized protein n=1 Tax=Entomophthora muscae TaxID=34485 RepID=A0ACC2SST4_9FUNG|nr:hypothetical protein DSO57_1019377 [Entomophthora muscae]
MTPHVTMQPDHLQETVIANEPTSTHLFVILYITHTGLVDAMVPTNGPWAFLLAPILCWALPIGPAGCPPASFLNLLQAGSLTPGKGIQTETKLLGAPVQCFKPFLRQRRITK